MNLTIQLVFYGIILFNLILTVIELILSYKKTKEKLPDNVSDIYDKEKYNTWLNYYKDNFKVTCISKIVNEIIEITLLVSGFFVVYNNFLVNNGITNPVLNAVILISTLSLIGALINLPFKYYDTFVIEEKYGFNKTTKKLFVVDFIKGTLISLVLYGCIFATLIALYIQVGAMLIVYGSIIIFIVILIIMLLYGKVFSKISNKQTPLEEGSLKDKINEFATKVDYSISDIFMMDGSKRSTKANAYCTGTGKTKRIVLYDTIINQLTEEEIVAVLAHEIGHAKHKHQLKSLPLSLLNIIILIAGFFLLLEFKQLSLAFGFNEINYGFVLIIFFVLISPISLISQIIINKISRNNEFQADKYAIDNYDKEIMKSALKKIHGENFSNINPSKLTVVLHHGHPPISERIEAIDKIN